MAYINLSGLLSGHTTSDEDVVEVYQNNLKAKSSFLPNIPLKDFLLDYAEKVATFVDNFYTRASELVIEDLRKYDESVMFQMAYELANGGSNVVGEKSIRYKAIMMMVDFVRYFNMDNCILIKYSTELQFESLIGDTIKFNLYKEQEYQTLGGVKAVVERFVVRYIQEYLNERIAFTDFDARKFKGENYKRDEIIGFENNRHIALSFHSFPLTYDHYDNNRAMAYFPATIDAEGVYVAGKDVVCNSPQPQKPQTNKLALSYGFSSQYREELGTPIVNDEYAQRLKHILDFTERIHKILYSNIKANEAEVGFGIFDNDLGFEDVGALVEVKDTPKFDDLEDLTKSLSPIVYEGNYDKVLQKAQRIVKSKGAVNYKRGGFTFENRGDMYEASDLSNNTQVKIESPISISLKDDEVKYTISENNSYMTKGTIKDKIYGVISKVVNNLEYMNTNNIACTLNDIYGLSDDVTGCCEGLVKYIKSLFIVYMTNNATNNNEGFTLTTTDNLSVYFRIFEY